MQLEDMMVALLQLGAEGNEEMIELIKQYSGPFEMQVRLNKCHIF